MKHRIILFLLLALPLLAPAQVRYKATKNANGAQVVRKESVPGSGVFDVVVSTLPSDAVRARLAGKVAIPYALEPRSALNFSQFGLDKYFDPNFRFSMDYRPLNFSLDDMRRRGQNLFGSFQIKDDGGVERATIPFPQHLWYDTESGIHGQYEGVGLYHASLETMEAYYQHSTHPATQGYWVANIETSNEWWPGPSGQLYPGFPGQCNGSYNTAHSGAWNDLKSQTIRLESNNGEQITVEGLAQRGYFPWAAEMITRRSNRLAVMMQSVRMRSPQGAFIGYGGSMYQGQPNIATAYQTNSFNDGDANPGAFNHDANGNVLLNGRTYNLTGNFYKWETFHMDYYYWLTFDVTNQDYNEIWQQQQPDKVQFQYIWGRIRPVHVVADQIGHHQANDYRMRNGRGTPDRPVIAMREFLYEDNQAGNVLGVGYNIIGRVPNAMGAECLDFKNGGSTCDDAVKIWIPPYAFYSYYVCARWYFANRPGSGFHGWNAPGQYTEAQIGAKGHHLHTVTAAWQARHDLQPYERFFGQSTLVEKPEVQIGQTGSWLSYDAINAYGYSDGTRGPQKPVYQIRYLAQAGGYRVLILGGMVQEHGQERIDNVRYQFPGMSSPVTFQVKLRGPAAQIYEFSVASSDGGQTYTATPVAQTSWEKAGYAGRVN